MSTSLIVALTAALLAASGEGQGPSFDCTAASTPVEWHICQNPRLVALDARLAKAYPGLRGGCAAPRLMG
jgi:uncharacterized protein